MKRTATNQMKSRRNFLRGAGVALALPWMESLPLMAADASSPAAKAAASKPPVRFATLYFSNGVEPIHWWAKGSGASMEIGPGLAPMMPYREDINFVRGLYNQQAVVSTSPHLGRMPNLLSGASVSLDPNDIRVGTTCDQVLARHGVGRGARWKGISKSASTSTATPSRCAGANSHFASASCALRSRRSSS